MLKLILKYALQSTIITLLAMKFINVRQDKAVMFGLMTFGVFFVLDGLIFPLFPQMEPTGIANTLEADMRSIGQGAERLGRSALNEVEDVGSSIGSEMRSVGRSARSDLDYVGRGAERVGRSAMNGVEAVGRGAQRVGRSALNEVEYVGDAAGSDMRRFGRSVESTF